MKKILTVVIIGCLLAPVTSYGFITPDLTTKSKTLTIEAESLDMYYVECDTPAHVIEMGDGVSTVTKYKAPWLRNVKLVDEIWKAPEPMDRVKRGIIKFDPSKVPKPIRITTIQIIAKLTDREYRRARDGIVIDPIS